MKQTVVFSGTIVGERQRVQCKVRATKATLDTFPPLVTKVYSSR
jgi:hypothetical protein